MKCSNPKKIVVKKNGTEYTLFVPCGKCYACQNVSRAEWALRCSYELKTAKSVSFITLTYDNKNLPHTCCDRTFKHLCNIEELKRVTARRWDFARLNKKHAQDFVKDMQKLLKKRFDDKSLLFRVFLSAEYGDVTNRPHYHAIIFSPVELHEVDFENLVKSCWSYGQINVQCDITPGAVINYVAKHQVKTCAGCRSQQIEAPIFKIVSRYGGGLGYNMKNDIELRNRYFDDDQDNFISVIQGNVEYKLAYPRYLLKHLRNYRNLEEWEVSDLSNVSRKNMEKQVSEILFFKNDLAVYDSEGNFDFDETVKKVRDFCRKRDNHQRENYEKQKRLKKVNKLELNNLNNSNYEFI